MQASCPNQNNQTSLKKCSYIETVWVSVLIVEEQELLPLHNTIEEQTNRSELFLADVAVFFKGLSEDDMLKITYQRLRDGSIDSCTWGSEVLSWRYDLKYWVNAFKTDYADHYRILSISGTNQTINVERSL